MDETLLTSIAAAVLRIETKLDTLIAALADEDDEEPTLTLDGQQDGRERDQSQSLG